MRGPRSRPAAEDRRAAASAAVLESLAAHRRRVSDALRAVARDPKEAPSGDPTLSRALARAVDEVVASGSVRVAVHVGPEADPHPDPLLCDTAQALMTTIADRADATSATIRVSLHGGQLLMTVTDDGRPGSGGRGRAEPVAPSRLERAARARGGTFAVAPVHPSGTTAVLVLPVTDGARGGA